jgi:pumilio family protein 6
MSMAHDTVRVIECLMQYGNENQRATIFNELTDGLVELSKSKYGRFLLIKMLNYGTKEQKDQVIGQFKGFSVKLIKHSVRV